MIAEQRDKYSWQFVFLGANQDAIASAAKYGLEAGQALTYGANHQGTVAAFDVLDQKVHKLRTSKASGEGDTKFEFSPDERNRAVGK